MKQTGIIYPPGRGFPEGKICIKCARRWERENVGRYDEGSGLSTHPLLEGDSFSCTLCDLKFGVSAAAAVMGRKGGKVKSEAKTAAARENAKKGGRPKKEYEV